MRKFFSFLLKGRKLHLMRCNFFLSKRKNENIMYQYIPEYRYHADKR